MRHPVTFPALAFLALAILAAPTAAQAGPAPVLSIEDLKSPVPPLTGDEPANVTAAWRYTLQSPAQAAAAYASGKTVIHWKAVCDDPAVRLSGPAETEVQFAPAQTSYSGPVSWTVEAAAPAQKIVKCKLTARAQAAGPLVPESNEVVGAFTVTVGSPAGALAKAVHESGQEPAALHAEQAPGVTFLGGLAAVGAALAMGRRWQLR